MEGVTKPDHGKLLGGASGALIDLDEAARRASDSMRQVAASMAAMSPALLRVRDDLADAQLEELRASLSKERHDPSSVFTIPEGLDWIVGVG